MQSQTFILVGRSGSGKGTQLELLQKYLSDKDSARTQKSLIMGDIYRTFFKETGYVQDIARDVSMNQGKFQPDFLTNALFINTAIHIADAGSHIFIDGYPRTVSQLETAKTFLEYTKRSGAIVLNIDVSREEVKQRMMKRGRGDDSESAIESRLDEYERTVIPMLASVKSDSFFAYKEVNGEQSVEEVHADIKKALGI